MTLIRLGLGLGVLGLLLLGGGGSAVVHAQPDSVRAAILKEKGFSPDHSPRKALWRAAALPGWGQVYNRQYYKLPFVYGGLAGGGYAIYEMNRRYLLYRHANLYKIGQNESSGENGTNPYQHFKDEYDTVVAQLGGQQVGGSVSGRQLRTLRDKYRRWRDLSILGTGLFYALTLLDAYVSAHLLTFNVGDVAVRVRPTGGGRVAAEMEGRAAGLPRRGRPSPKGAGLRVQVRF
ncbi:MAG: DUF5683 domain-containing protein [Salinibacter sp.]